MTNEEFEIVVIDYLRGTLPLEEQKAFEELLNGNSNYKKIYNELLETWALMDVDRAPEPSKKMDDAFFGILRMEQEKQKGSESKNRSLLDILVLWLSKPQLAYALLIMVLIGSYFFKGNADSSTTSSQKVVDANTREIREKLVLTLLEQGSANKRLQGVSEANKIMEVDEKVVQALLRTLNNDPNVNVRLAAVESLTNYVGNPVVRQGLIQSIPNQESPIVQVTLANLMLALEEKRSIEPFKKLLERDELDTTVKRKIEKTIESII